MDFHESPNYKRPISNQILLVDPLTIGRLFNKATDYDYALIGSGAPCFDVLYEVTK